MLDMYEFWSLESGVWTVKPATWIVLPAPVDLVAEAAAEEAVAEAEPEALTEAEPEAEPDLEALAVVVASWIEPVEIVVVVEVKKPAEDWEVYFSAHKEEMAGKTPLPTLLTALTFGAGNSWEASFK
ncbi:hypothetical protein WICPIJ_001357 [Wickerhamomyces pijperi]|uniref:Uncharacterized protein n=1 Tax=Wickerhamomyces pijperi TaxID=599730 RepID=A0A9P8QDG7_WICPI|nr:hypothetical protein WICPIJ_001357 [Wickerhamomyces pijperi]